MKVRRWVPVVLVAVVALGAGAALGARYLRWAPDLTLMTVHEARTALSQVGLTLGSESANAEFGPLPREQVMHQSPPTWVPVLLGSNIIVTTRPPAESSIMPDMFARTASDAVQQALDAGLYPTGLSEYADISEIRQEYGNDYSVIDPEDMAVVIGQEPQAGAHLAYGSEIELTVVDAHGEGRSPAAEVDGFHGVFWSRYGLEGARTCSTCHAARTCSNDCHDSAAYADLYSWNRRVHSK